MLEIMTELPARLGSRPRTTTQTPHRQVSQVASPGLWGRTVSAIFSLPHVVEGHSAVAPAGSRAVFLDDMPVALARETSLAPLDQRLEPVHLHGVFDTSLHLCLPAARARKICALGWGEPHHYSDHENDIMVYGPRDREELSVILTIVQESIAFARGAASTSRTS